MSPLTVAPKDQHLVVDEYGTRLVHFRVMAKYKIVQKFHFSLKHYFQTWHEINFLTGRC